MKITKITETKNRKKYNIYLDDNYAGSLDKFVAYSHFLKEGKEISQKEFDQMLFESQKEGLFASSIAHLTKYPKTEKEFRLHLKNKDILPVLMDDTVAKLKEINLLNDELYAKAYLEDRQSQKGLIYIKNMLKQKGVSSEILETLEIPAETQLESGQKEWEKYFRHKDYTFENIQKAKNNLLRKGFSYDIVREVEKNASEED